jgi:hypothetical protein
MGGMELIYLLVGVGLGFVASYVTRLPKKSEVSGVSAPQGTERPNTELPKEQGTDRPNTELPKEEPKPTQLDVNRDNIEPLKEELKQTQLAYEMAKQMSQFKGGFLARTSHELRSPLSSLIGMHQLILSDLCDSPEEEREFIAQANTSALKMVKLLSELTDVSKVEHGKARLEISSLPLSKVFENLHTLTHMQAANSNLQLEVISPDADIYVLADQRHFQQVLVGLVDTAITRMESGSIRVSAACFPESEETHIWIDVQSPTPIWSEAVDSLSTTAEIEAKSDKTSEIPPGLSLLMVQTLVEVMGGRLELLTVPSEESASDATTENVIRLQCSMPLATPETVEQPSAYD